MSSFIAPSDHSDSTTPRVNPASPVDGELSVIGRSDEWHLQRFDARLGEHETIGVYADFATADEILSIATRQPGERNQGAGKSPNAPSRALLFSGVDRVDPVNDRGRPEDDGTPVHPHVPETALQALMEAPPGTDPATSLDELHAVPVVDFDAILDALTDKQKMVLALRDEGLGYGGIAAETGMSVRAVRTTLDRIKGHFVRAGVVAS